MNQGDGMAEVTEADVLRAREVLDSAGHRHEFTPTLTATIAAALAEEREKARAPFLAVAEEAEQQPKGYQYVAAALIRRAAEVTE